MWFYKWLSKNFSKPTSKNGEVILIFRAIFINLENQLNCTAEFIPKALKQLFDKKKIADMEWKHMICTGSKVDIDGVDLIPSDHEVDSDDDE